MTDLKRSLSLFDLTMIAVGSTIGSGIFLTPSLIAKALPSPLWILFVWVIGGLMALSGALTFAELGGMMPRAGGVYVFLSEAYGGLAGFLYGWAYFWVVNTGGVAALAIAFATYLGYFVPLSTGGITTVAIGGLLFVTIVNIVGAKAGGIFSDVFTILKLAGIGLLLVVGFGWGSSSATNFSAPLSGISTGISSALAAALVGVFWSYGGWQHATFAAAEATNPRRDVPISLVVGASLVIVLYLAVNVAYMMLLDTKAIASSSRVAADAISGVIGPLGGSLIALTIFVSTFGTCGIYTLTAPRIYYAMANDGVFFKNVAYVHPRFRTPVYAILFQSAWAIILILSWRTFEDLISYVVFTDWIFFAMTGASVFVFRKRAPHAERPYRTLGYPITPLFFTGVAVWFVVNTLIERPAQAWAGLGLLAAGVPVYFYWKKQSVSPIDSTDDV